VSSTRRLTEEQKVVKNNDHAFLTVLSVRFSTIAANAGMEAVLTDLQYEKKIWK